MSEGNGARQGTVTLLANHEPLGCDCRSWLRFPEASRRLSFEANREDNSSMVIGAGFAVVTAHVRPHCGFGKLKMPL